MLRLGPAAWSTLSLTPASWLCRIAGGHPTTTTVLCRAKTSLVTDLPPEDDPQKTEKVKHPKEVPIIPLETSLKYMQSQAYKDTYGTAPVWVPYRRNFKGQFAPKRTRRTCIGTTEGHVLRTGNPCPICRDEYLVLDYRNTDLLKQFISPYNGELLPTSKTNLCRQRHFELRVEIEKAKDCGTISFDVPLREYDYSEYKDIV